MFHQVSAPQYKIAPLGNVINTITFIFLIYFCYQNKFDIIYNFLSFSKQIYYRTLSSSLFGIIWRRLMIQLVAKQVFLKKFFFWKKHLNFFFHFLKIRKKDIWNSCSLGVERLFLQPSRPNCLMILSSRAPIGIPKQSVLCRKKGSNLFHSQFDLFSRLVSYIILVLIQCWERTTVSVFLCDKKGSNLFYYNYNLSSST